MYCFKGRNKIVAERKEKRNPLTAGFTLLLCLIFLPVGIDNCKLPMPPSYAK